MIELQLVGYTADLRFLVCADAEGKSRFKLSVEDDLVATLNEIMGLIGPDHPGVTVPPAPRAPELPPDVAGDTGELQVVAARAGAVTRPGVGPLAGIALLMKSYESETEGEVELVPARESRLSPREVQALLRAGRPVRKVAAQAGMEEKWVQRWLTPIEAERDQVLRAVQQRRTEKARLGPSFDPIGEAVRRNLQTKGIAPDDDRVAWSASRQDGAVHWVVSLTYRSRGRQQKATWHFDPEGGELEPRNRLATEIGWTRERTAAGAPTTAGQSTPQLDARARATTPAAGSAAETPARGSTRKRTPAQRGTAKRTAKQTKSTAAKKSAAKKSAAKKSAVKKSAVKQSAVKRSTAKKSTAKKSTARKSTAKRAPAKKAPVKKAPVKKAAPRTAKKASGAAPRGGRGTTRPPAT